MSAIQPQINASKSQPKSNRSCHRQTRDRGATRRKGAPPELGPDAARGHHRHGQSRCHVLCHARVCARCQAGARECEGPRFGCQGPGHEEQW